MGEEGEGEWAEGDGAAARRRGGAGETGAWGGTLLYLSPEAARGEPPDAGLDLWALAMVLYEAVAGRHPFAGEPAHRVMLRVHDGDVPDVRTLAPDVPAPLSDFLRDALHPRRRRRPSTAAELGERLRAVRASLAGIAA